MNGDYRDETESLRARAAHLEAQLASRERELDVLRQRLGDQEAVFTRLEGVIGGEKNTRPAGRWALAGGAALACLGLVSVAFGLNRGHVREHPEPPMIPASTVRPVAPMTAAAPLLGEDVCARLGVRITVAGEDAEAPAASDRDRAGHKYRRGGTRSPWFSVEGGPLYVHGVGDFLPDDVGTTELSLFTVMTKGETGGYRLARGGRSLLEVRGSDGKRVFGRFEADVSKVEDTTREAPFGTPVVRMRGTFCLPAMPANPEDTGP